MLVSKYEYYMKVVCCILLSSLINDRMYVCEIDQKAFMNSIKIPPGYITVCNYAKTC